MPQPAPKIIVNSSFVGYWGDVRYIWAGFMLVIAKIPKYTPFGYLFHPRDVPHSLSMDISKWYCTV